MSMYGKAPGDKPESTERQADMAELHHSKYKVQYSEMRMQQIRIRTLNAYGEINTRYPK